MDFERGNIDHVRVWGGGNRYNQLSASEDIFPFFKSLKIRNNQWIQDMSA